MKLAMTIAVSVGSLVMFLGSACGQQRPDQEELIKRRDAKLAEAWVEKASWNLDYDAVRAEAATNGKLIFAYFTRSYSP